MKKKILKNSKSGDSSLTTLEILSRVLIAAV